MHTFFDLHLWNRARTVEAMDRLAADESGAHRSPDASMCLHRPVNASNSTRACVWSTLRQQRIRPRTSAAGTTGTSEKAYYVTTSMFHWATHLLAGLWQHDKLVER